MSPFDSLLDRVTEKLARDQELRQEVRHELQAHLEDCTQEFEASGLKFEEAEKKATESFGDESEVAERLYLANRKRMQVRNSVRWAERIGLGPVAVAILAPMTLKTVASCLMLMAVLSMTSNGWWGGGMGSMRMMERSILAKLSPADRFTFEGPGGDMTAMERAQAVLDRYPTDPVIYANFAMTALRESTAMDTGSTDHPTTPDPAKVERIAAIMDQGEKIEPGNGFYPLIKASILLEASTRYIDEPEDKQPGFVWVSGNGKTIDSDGKPNRLTFERMEVVNRAWFARGMAAFHEAAGKPYLADHAMDYLKRRLSVLPKISSLGEELYQLTQGWSVLLPDLNHFRQASNVAASMAIQEAEAGHREAALAILHDSKAVAALHGRDQSPVLIGLLVDYGIQCLALADEVMVNDVLKSPAAEAAAKEKLKRAQDVMNSTRVGQNEGYAANMHHLSFMESAITPATVDWERVDLTPGRMAEYSVADQLGVVLMAGLLVATAGAGAVGLLIFRWRRGRWPMTLFVGWRRLGLILGVGVAGPIGIYIAYLALTGVRRYGLPMSLEREGLELAAVGAAMWVLLRLMTFGAIRARARELGIEAPPAFRPARSEIVVVVLFALAAIGFWIYWRLIVDQSPRVLYTQWGLMVAIAVALCAAVALRPAWMEVKKTRELSVLYKPLPLGGATVALLFYVVLMILGISYASYHFAQHVLIPAFPIVAIAILVTAAAVGAKRYMTAADAPSEPVGNLSLIGLRARITVSLLAAVVLMGTAGGLAKWNERRWAQRLDGSSMNVFNELERSRMRGLRDEMRAEAAG